MKNILSSFTQKVVILCVLSGIVLCSINTYADRQGRGDLGSNPGDILDYIAGEVNEDRIQDTALNDISPTQWQYASQYRLTNTLDAIRTQITPYIQWAMYIGFTAIVILIVYNGFLMVTNSVNGGAGDTSQIKTNLKNLALWWVGLGSIYLIIEGGMALIDYVIA